MSWASARYVLVCGTDVYPASRAPCSGTPPSSQRGPASTLQVVKVQVLYLGLREGCPITLPKTYAVSGCSSPLTSVRRMSRIARSRAEMGIARRCASSPSPGLTGSPPPRGSPSPAESRAIRQAIPSPTALRRSGSSPTRRLVFGEILCRSGRRIWELCAGLTRSVA